MKKSEVAERLERAQRLRQQIDDLTRGKSGDTSATKRESSVEFIHRRMQEIDGNKKDRSS